jgi:ectoine hydroxylase-related dioxygenase (phytanoyl-CoA dioxygenase family)
LATVPWHQDTAYLAPGAEHTLQPTAWIPFLDADAVNGTLQVIRGGHRSGQVFRHRAERTRGHEKSWYLYIADEDLPAGEIVTCEMPMGSLLLINQLIPHRSTENFSDKIRWSVDLRWQRPDEPSGFDKVKECILMRTSRDPEYRIDWTAWARKNRIADAMDQKPADPFDRRSRAQAPAVSTAGDPGLAPPPAPNARLCHCLVGMCHGYRFPQLHAVRAREGWTSAAWS